MKKKTELTKPEQILNTIFLVRGQRVILDTDLSRIYGIPVKRLNEAVKRNPARFPHDFMYQLTTQEAADLTSQISISGSSGGKNLRSQFATLDKRGRGRHRKYLPYAFTEQGAIMAANVLNSITAVRMSVFVVRAFVRMRNMLSSDKGLAEELKKLERKLTSRLNTHEAAIVDVLRRLIKALEPPEEVPLPEKTKGPIGFHP